NMSLRHALVAAALMLSGAPVAAQTVDYMRQIKPLLEHRCYACHGAMRQKSGLWRATPGFMRTGGERAPGIFPGKTDPSLLINKVTGGEGSPRPPEGE